MKQNVEKEKETIHQAKYIAMIPKQTAMYVLLSFRIKLKKKTSQKLTIPSFLFCGRYVCHHGRSYFC